VRRIDNTVSNVSTSLTTLTGSVSQLAVGLSSLSGDVTALRDESRKGIAAVAAFGAMALTPTAPGQIGLDVGVAGYKGQGALAGSVSYTTPGGVVVSGGVGYAGSGSAVVRLGIGWRFNLGVTAELPGVAATPPGASAVPAASAIAPMGGAVYVQPQVGFVPSNDTPR